MTERVTAVVVNWNGGAHLRACVDAIRASDVPVELVVVDNASSDGSLQQLPASVRVEQTGVNLGFGRGNNFGIAVAETPFVAIVNPDVRLETDTLSRLVAEIEQSEDIAIVGPTLFDGEGTPHLTCGKRPGTVGEICRKFLLHLIFPFLKFRQFRPVVPSDVDWVTGACMLTRRSAFDDIGGFDEAIFMYYEDVDLCLRLRDAGHRIRYLPEARARHFGGESSKHAIARMLVASDRSYRFFTCRHFGWLVARFLALLTPMEMILRGTGWLLVYLASRARRRDAGERLRAYRQLFFENLVPTFNGSADLLSDRDIRPLRG